MSLLPQCEALLKEVSSLRKVGQEHLLNSQDSISTGQVASKARTLLQDLHNLAGVMQNIAKTLSLVKTCCYNWTTREEIVGDDLIFAVSAAASPFQTVSVQSKELPLLLGSWSADFLALSDAAKNAAESLHNQQEQDKESSKRSSILKEERDSRVLRVVEYFSRRERQESTMECYVSEEDVREQAHPSHDETLLMQETNKLSLNEESEDPNIQPGLPGIQVKKKSPGGEFFSRLSL